MTDEEAEVLAGNLETLSAGGQMSPGGGGGNGAGGGLFLALVLIVVLIAMLLWSITKESQANQDQGASAPA